MVQVAFSSAFKSANATTQAEESSSFTGSALVGASDIRFESSDPTAVSFSGNNVPGVLTYVLGGLTYAIEGIASRLFKSGSTIQGFYFIESGPDFALASGEKANAFILVYPGRESAFPTSPGTYGTSSDPVDSALNSLLSAQPGLTSITQNDADLSVAIGQKVLYTFTFSKDIDASTFTAADLANTGTASVTFGAITEISPGVFTVEVTPTTSGSVTLSIIENAQILTPTGLALNTGSAIVDDQTLTVPASPVTVQSVAARDPGVALGSGDSAVVEGASLAFDVTLSRTTDASTQFDLALDPASVALAGDIGSYAFTDGVTYDPGTGKITVPAGVSSFSIIVPTVDDAVVESTEALTLAVGGVTSAGSIIDNDDVEVSSILVRDLSTGPASADTSVVEGGSLLFTISLTTATTDPAGTVFPFSLGGTASGADYASLVFSNGVTYDPIAGTITIPDGVSSFTVTAPTADDASVETTETLSLSVGGLSAAGTITDNDVVSIKSVTAQDASSAPGSGDSIVTEGGALLYEITLSAATAASTTFALTINGSASTSDYGGFVFSNGVTYDSATGLITVPAGVSDFSISVATSDDSSIEISETLVLAIDGVSSVGTILDNDAIAVSSVSVADAAGSSASDSTVTEGGTLRYAITLSGTTASSVSLPFSMGGSASPADYGALTFSNGVTYDPTTGLITIPSGVSSFTVDAPTTDDLSLETSETLSLSVDGVTATGTIVDNDTLSISGVVAEDDANPGVNDSAITEGGALRFTVSLSAAAASPETFAFALSGDAAATDYGAAVFSDGVTYDPVTGLITIPAGVSSFTVTLPTVDDADVEATETLTLVVGGLSATGTIEDNDVITVTDVDAEDASSAPGSGDSTVTEGDDLRYVVTLNSATIAPTEITLAIGGDGEAADYDDFVFSDGVTYDPVTGKVTVPAGVSSFTITAPTLDDGDVEPTETLDLTIGGVTASGEIEDNDVTGVTGASARDPAGAAGDDAVEEGDSLEYVVTLNGATLAPTTISLTIGGSAAAADYAAFTFSDGVTYDATTGLLTIPAGVDGFTITAPTTDDAAVEAAETLALTIGGVAATGTITDNDSIAIASVSAKEAGGAVGDSSVVEGATLEYSVTLNGATLAPETFPLTIGGTAAGADYSAFTFTNGVTYDAVTGTITIPAGVSSFKISAPTVDDAGVESSETLILTVGGVSATGTITDNDAITVTGVTARDPSGGATDSTVTEGEPLEFTVTLSAATPTTKTFPLTFGGTTERGDVRTLTFSDGVTYDPTTGLLTVPAGVSSFTITAPTHDDTQVEITETYTLGIDGVTASGRIRDNDEVTVSAVNAQDGAGALGDAVVTEGGVLLFPVTLSDAPLNPITFPFALTGGAVPADYLAISFSHGVVYDPATGLITIPAGVSSFYIAASTADDALVESTESLGVTLGGFSAVGTILDNDAGPPPVQVNAITPRDPNGAAGDSSVVEGAPIDYVVTLSGPPAAPLVLPFSFSGGASPSDRSAPTFTNGVTYDPLTGQITIPAGVSSFNIRVPTIDDALVESTESLGVTLGGLSAAGTILDNDAAPPEPGDPVYAVREPNGDVFYTGVATQAAAHAAQTGGTVLGSAFQSATSGQSLIAYQNWLTGDWFYALEGAPLPYDCYERVGPVPNVLVNPAGAGGVDVHAFVDGAGKTLFATVNLAQASDLAGRGFVDLGASFSVPVIGSNAMWSSL
jgi:hypothetical protein